MGKKDANGTGNHWEGPNGTMEINQDMQRRDEQTLKEKKEKKRGEIDMLYTINENPPWYLSILLGVQHFIAMFNMATTDMENIGVLSFILILKHFMAMCSSGITFPLIMAPIMCIKDELVLAQIVGTIYFAMGFATVLQCFLGSRLPIVQGGAAAYLAPMFAILSLPHLKCPVDNVGGASADNATITLMAENMTMGEDPGDWKIRMREISGAVFTASLFEVALGAFGVVGVVLRFIGPITVATTISLIALSLTGAALGLSQGNWAVAFMSMCFVILFSMYMRKVGIPTPCCGNQQKFHLFVMFPVILSILVSWLICYILTITDTIPVDRQHWAYGARTDIRASAITNAPWFRFPYPGQFGAPTFSVAGTFGMLAAVLASVVESVGDYYACARISDAPPPPTHAVNRGICLEGISSVLSGLWGTGSGTTSYSGNIGLLGITKVASRRVVLWAGVVMMVMGLVNKVGGVFVAIPSPVIGGVFFTIIGMVFSVGISNLQFADLNSTRNLFIFGLSFFVGIAFPQWLSSHQGYIKTGHAVGDQILHVLLSTGMFVGGVLAFILDNTVPGSAEERGMHVWTQVPIDERTEEEAQELKVYNLPFINDFLTRPSWTRYFPMCPSFDGCCSGRGRRGRKVEDAEAVEVKYQGHEDVVIANPGAASRNGDVLKVGNVGGMNTDTSHSSNL